MTRLGTLHKGANAIRKGQAMFAWLEDVAKAFIEVGELEQTLDSLREGVAAAEKARDTIADELQVLNRDYSDARHIVARAEGAAKAVAASIIAEAKEEAERLTEEAGEAATSTYIHMDIDRAKHEEFMGSAGAVERQLQGKVDAFRAKLAEIKARL